MRCRTCGAEVELREVEATRATVGAFCVELFGLRLGRCETAGHPAEPPQPDFAADLISAVVVGGAFPAAQQRGILRKRLCCSRCAADLAGVAATPGCVRARVRVERAAGLTLSVEGPSLECPGCGQRQLEAESAGRATLTQALFAALAGAGLSLPE